jgi:hypothetical protein
VIKKYGELLKELQDVVAKIKDRVILINGVVVKSYYFKSIIRNLEIGGSYNTTHHTDDSGSVLIIPINKDAILYYFKYYDLLTSKEVFTNLEYLHPYYFNDKKIHSLSINFNYPPFTLPKNPLTFIFIEL